MSRLCDGLYIEGSVEGKPVLFSADTGASRTVISSRVYKGIENSNRPQLQKRVCLRGAGGAPIEEMGKALFRLRLGTLEVITEAIVAQIEDDALLGLDVLTDSKSGPANILLSRNKIVLGGIEIPCIRIGGTQMCRKMVVGDVVTPGNSEAWVDVFVEKMKEDDLDPNPSLSIELTKSFASRHMLEMASNLVNINRQTKKAGLEYSGREESRNVWKAERRKNVAEEKTAKRKLAEEKKVRRLAEEKMVRMLANEKTERKRIAEEKKIRRLAEEKKVRIAERKAVRRLADEKKVRRIKEEKTERKRIVEEKQVRRLAEEEKVRKIAEEKAVRRRLADEKKVRRIIEEKTKRLTIVGETIGKRKTARIMF